jgi:type III secretion protein C
VSFKPPRSTPPPRPRTRGQRAARGVATLALAAITLASLAGAQPAEAAVVRWKSPQIEYAAEGKDVKDVLRDFAASQGIPAMIGSNVSGTVSGRFHMPPQRFLDTLAATFGFIWYYDGTVLDIVAPSDMTNAVIDLDSASVREMQMTLEQMGVADKRFPLTYDAAQGVAIVSGPPSYVKTVKDVARRVDRKSTHRMGDEVRIFPLAHAWAMDRTVNIDGQTVTIPGVATLLNNMYHPQSSAGSEMGGAGRKLSYLTRNTPSRDVYGATGGGASPGGAGNNSGYVALPPLPNGSNGGPPAPSGQMQQARAAASPDESPPDDSHKDDALPVFQADPRTNSVLVRDAPDRMFQYPELLRRLDVKPQLIEISAQIIEVQDNALDQLGVEWSLHNSHVDLQTGAGGAQTTYNGTLAPSFGTTTLSGGTSVAAAPLGMSLSAVLGDAGRYLLSRIDALTQLDRAKIDASPKVATLNNVEAVMDNATRFFVPVAGYASADLYTVSTGVSLRVLPMVVEENGTTQIKLDVAIQDGQLTSQTVSNLPVITSTNINTSAFISQGQALLIAGYRVDNRSNTSAGIPGLSKIPVIGGLFRTTGHTDNHMERLFLLTPRIIEP